MRVNKKIKRNIIFISLFALGALLALVPWTDVVDFGPTINSALGVFGMLLFFFMFLVISRIEK